MFVLWGYHPAYGTVPIKLAAAKPGGLAAEMRRREAQGFLCAILPQYEAPTSLRERVALLRASAIA